MELLDESLVPEAVRGVKREARQFAEDVVRPNAARHFRDGTYPTDVVDATSEAGFVGTEISPEHGGHGASLLESLDVNDFVATGRSVRGVAEGDSYPKEFIPELVDLYQQGRFPFDELVEYYEFEPIEEAVSDSKSGDTVKPILRIGEE